ncbi:unnamed protein product [Urochloa humidicola]
MAATDVAAAATVMMPIDSVDLDDFDDVVLQDDLDYFDLGDLASADEFCDAYSAFLANADANKIVGVGGSGGAATGGWMGELCGGGGGGEVSSSTEGSPDSVVTDGPLAGDEDVSAFVAELERFLMEDGDVGPDGDRTDQGIICADDFFGDLLADDDFNCFVKAAAAAAGALQNGEVDNDGDVLAAREEDDEPTSRKRARHKIKGTTMTTWWRELEMTRRHLAPIQVPAPCWLPTEAVLLCCM